MENYDDILANVESLVRGSEEMKGLLSDLHSAIKELLEGDM